MAQQSKLLKAQSIAEEGASGNYRYGIKVCMNQCACLVSAFGEVHNFLKKLQGLTGKPVEFDTHDIWDPLVFALHRGAELLKSCMSDDWVVRSLLCHESREDFQDVHAELFSCVELLSTWLLEVATSDAQRSVIRKAWSSCFQTRTEHNGLEDAARVDREQLLAKSLKKKKQKPFIRIQDSNHVALQMLFDVLLDNSEAEERSAIEQSQIKLKEPIGQGAYGSIYEARWLGRTFAVKVFLPGDTSFPRELAVLASHKHPNILRIVGHSYDNRKGQYSLVMEKMDMDLAAFLRMREGDLPLAKSLDILVQIAKGMAWLHSKEVIHRDLKPENILVSQSWGGEQLSVRISDFGLARTNFITSCISGATSRRGTKAFMAPEVWNSEHYSKKADVYSFGVLSYQVLTGLQPFKDIHKQTDFMDLVCSGSRPVFPAGMAKEVMDLVESCWKGIAEERPDFKLVRDKLIMLRADTLIGSSRAWQLLF